MLDKFVSAAWRLVRPSITTGFAAAFVYGFVTKLISADVFVGVVVLVIKYWFDERKER